MSRKSTPSLGAFHPVLFFLFVYGISLFLAIFVCRTVYNSIHDEGSRVQLNTTIAASPAGATAMR
jgi:hypothetical protein